MRETLKELERQCSDDRERKAMADQHKKQVNTNQPAAKAAQFISSIGIMGYANLYTAFVNSDIPQRFIDAKQKNSRLAYPLG